MTLVFGAIMAIGLLYLFLTILGGLGEFLDFGVDGALDSLGIDTLFGIGDASGAGDASGIGCMVLSVFLAVFGGVGLAGSLAEWDIAVTVLLSLGIGWMLTRVTAAILKPIVTQDSTDVFSKSSLIGKTARVTIESPAGKTGEVMIDAGQTLKYPVKEVNDEALHRGDTVEIIAVEGRFLKVRKV